MFNVVMSQGHYSTRSAYTPLSDIVLKGRWEETVLTVLLCSICGLSSAMVMQFRKMKANTT